MTTFAHLKDIPLFRYGLIMADFPWDFENWSEKGEGRNPKNHYDVMSLDDLYEIPLGQFCGPHSVLWFWITSPFLPHGFRMFERWGFEYVALGYWGKTQKGDPSSPKMGNGHTLRECGEPFLIGKVGRPEFRDKGIPGLILEPRREPGRKPEIAYKYAERLAPKGLPMLDMFSRQERVGWDVFGNETNKFEVAA